MKKHKKIHNSREIIIISIQHMGESILFTDCMRELRQFFSREKGYRLRFYGNLSSVNYYKEYLDCELDEYVAVDTEFAIVSGTMTRLKDFKRLCHHISQYTPEQIILPFSGFWGYLISTAVYSDTQWCVRCTNDRSHSSILYKYLERHSSENVVYYEDNEMMFLRYAKLLRQIGIGDYRSKIGRIRAGNIYDNEIKEVIEKNPAYCVIVPGALEKARRWETNKYVEVIQYIRKSYGLSCLIVGTKEEKVLGEEIKKSFKADEKVQTLAGRTSLHDLMAVLQKSCFVLGNDTGTTHMAAALGKEYITLFSYKDVGIYLPYSVDILRVDDKMPIIAALTKKPDCAGCHINSDLPRYRIEWKNMTCRENVMIGSPFSCLSGITVEQVCRKIDCILEGYC